MLCHIRNSNKHVYETVLKLVHWRKVMLGEFMLRTLVVSMTLCSKGQRVPLLNIFFFLNVKVLFKTT